MNKTKTKVYIFFAFSLLFFFSFSAQAQVSGPNPPSLAVPGQPEIIAKIKLAKEMLAPVKLNYQLTPVYSTNKKTQKKTLSSYQLGLRDLFVAVHVPSTGEIKITGAMQNGKSFTFPDKNFDIDLVRFNGVNSRFKVNKPEGGQIIAVKYLITPVEKGSKQSIENSLYEAYYTPYHAYLDTPEVQKYGEKYLTSVIEQVAYQLQNYPSVSQPGKTLVEAIKPSLVRALVYAEHLDTNELLGASETEEIQNIINRVNTLFAVNEADTYRYSGSSAGALGISQFIQSTYLGLAKRHPNANLIGEWKAGMADHVNSIKATYLLLDDYIQGVKTRAESAFIPGQAFDFGVAAYNGGVTRVARAVNYFGINWNGNEPLAAKAAKIADANSLAAKIESLRKQTLAQKDKAKRAAMQKELDGMRAQHKIVKSELENLEAAILRDETRGYLQKIYKVIAVFNQNPPSITAATAANEPSF